MIKNWQDQYTTYLLSQDIHSDGAHDMGHLRRVYKTAVRLDQAEGSPSDPLVLLTACYFHDLVSLPKNHPDRNQASRLAAEKTGELLKNYFTGFPFEKIPFVEHAILTHSFSAGIPPETWEAKLLQDADRMEAIGAIGIARTFYTAGIMHSRMFHEDDPMGEHRVLDDKSYSLDHFEVKLLQLPGMMQTAAGREMAASRAEVLLRFREQMVSEILG